jgi:hypothetical protein
MSRVIYKLKEMFPYRHPEASCTKDTTHYLKSQLRQNSNICKAHAKAVDEHRCEI